MSGHYHGSASCNDEDISRRCIYKVPEPLRKVKEEAYTPQLVSIGPLRRNNIDQYKSLEKIKEEYIEAFLNDENNNGDRNKFLGIIKNRKNKIEECYEDLDLDDDDNDKLEEIILKDSIFIIVLFIRDYWEKNFAKDFIASEDAWPLGITFEGGVLSMPTLKVSDSTERLYRNLMAFEQCHYPKEAYICNYIRFIDELINTEDDVELLIEKGVLVNSLGNNEKVSNLFNDLNNGIVRANFCYETIFQRLNDHYGTCWYRAVATLRHAYFTNFWRVVKGMPMVHPKHQRWRLSCLGRKTVQAGDTEKALPRLQAHLGSKRIPGALFNERDFYNNPTPPMVEV
ncbi:hypothetical protein GH714_034132 [Hevea brasiliensis]|uniref:Uncharacterized protein n=1 Tax=Hevea brasiliensis TaxID=3981 RepID=A0A6A6L591_HEVBR|nr:hypothetical protein GH714_034132 [Hevea brasiliensis]